MKLVTTALEWSHAAGEYEVLPLADFGTVKFTDATATADASRPAFVFEQSSTGDKPSSLSSDGSSFSVTWESTGTADAAPTGAAGGYPPAGGFGF